MAPRGGPLDSGLDKVARQVCRNKGDHGDQLVDAQEPTGRRDKQKRPLRQLMCRPGTRRAHFSVSGVQTGREPLLDI